MKKKWNYRTSICKFQSNEIITKLRYFDHTLVFVVHLYLLIFLVIPVLLFIFILMVIVTCICFRCKSCLFVCTMSVAKFVSLQIHWFMLKLSRLLAGWGYSKTWKKKKLQKINTFRIHPSKWTFSLHIEVWICWHKGSVAVWFLFDP